MRAYIDSLRKETNTRKYQLNTIDEFLKDPVIHVSRKYITDLTELEGMLPEHTTIDEEKKPSVTFVFKDLKGRDEAKAIFDKLGIFFRAGKTLVPFRLSGNVDWGVKVPSKDGLDNLTFWVWPESLWAPVSFTRTYLKEKGASDDEWKNWWDSKDCTVYQFIGEDNIYFYGIAEMAMLMGLKHPYNTELDVEDVNFPHLIANRHILFMDTKASSSSEIKTSDGK
jgi:methionyl-tRNA synthetase